MHSTSLVKTLVKPFIPNFVLSWRGRRIARIRKELSQQLYAAAGGRILGGPFAGMLYVDQASVDPSLGNHLGPLLLGTYESELHKIVEEIVALQPKWVVNVGAGEGYYAVGLLTVSPLTRMIAFEANDRNQSLIRKVGELNQVADRLEVLGTCRSGDLTGALANPGSLLIMDVEGMEEQLLDPASCPALIDSMILVEVHDHLRPGVSKTLRQWYAPTHDITAQQTVGSGAVSLPAVAGLSKNQVRMLAEEPRPAMQWFWMTPRSSGRASAT